MNKVKHLSIVRKTNESPAQAQTNKNDFTVFIPKSTLSLMVHLEVNQELVQNQIERLDNNMNKLKKGINDFEEFENIISRLKTLTSSSRKSAKKMVMACDLR